MRVFPEISGLGGGSSLDIGGPHLWVLNKQRRWINHQSVSPPSLRARKHLTSAWDISCWPLDSRIYTSATLAGTQDFGLKLSYTLPFPGSEALGPELSHDTSILGSLAHRQPAVGLLRCHNHVSQISLTNPPAYMYVHMLLLSIMPLHGTLIHKVVYKKRLLPRMRKIIS